MLDNDWDAYWFCGKANAMAEEEEEFADLMMRQMNLKLDPSLAEAASWRVGGCWWDNPIQCINLS